MKIKIIGSGSIRSKSTSACYIIDNHIMIDYPNGVSKILYKQNIEPNQINHILITHFHGDHYFDIPFYMYDKFITKEQNTNIYCSRIGKIAIKKLGFLAFQFSFKKYCTKTNLIFNHKSKFNIENFEVEKYIMSHGHVKKARGYILTKGKISIGFTGDTSLCKNVELMAKKCNYLFCDCTLIKGNEKHQGIDNLEYLAKKYPNCTFIASHLGTKTKIKLLTIKIKNLIIAEDEKEIKI